MGYNVPGSGGGRQYNLPSPRQGSPPRTGAGVALDRPIHGSSGAGVTRYVRQSTQNAARATASYRARNAAPSSIANVINDRPLHGWSGQSQLQQVRQSQRNIARANAAYLNRQREESRTVSALLGEAGRAIGAAHTVHSGGLLGTGAILDIPGVSDLSTSLGKIGKHLGSDLLNLPPSLIEGSTQLATSLFSDALHGKLGSALTGATGIGPSSASKTGAMIHSAAQQDPLYQLLTLHPGAAARLAGQHPLNAILDATGAGGAVARGVGGLARTGALGDELAKATALARSREVAPGIPGTAVAKPYSRNVVTQALQKAVERHPGVIPQTPFTGTAGALKRQVAMFYGPEKSRMARTYLDTAKAAKKAKPGKVEANVVPYAAAFGAGDRAALSALLRDAIEAKSGAYGPLRLGTEKALDTHIKNLTAAVNKPNLDEAAIQRAATLYNARQAPLEAQKVDLGLHESPELKSALEKQYALQQIPGTQLLQKPIIHPTSILERRRAGAALREAQANLREAQGNAAKDLSAHQGASRALTTAANKLPLHPVTDNVASHLLDLKTAIEQSRTASKAGSAERIAAAKDALKAAQSDYNLVKQNPEKLGGLVVHDPSATPIPSGSLKGQTLRPLTSEEVQAHMAANATNPVSYVRMTNPDRGRPTSLGRGTPERPLASSATGKSYTGQAAKVGDWTPGHASLVRSQLSDVRQIGSARIEQGFLNRFGMRDPQGNYFTPHNWEHAQDAYLRSTGIQTVPKNVTPDQIVLVPKTALDELDRQRALEQPKGVAKLAMKVNRGFRDTVLPMSPKLPVMHTVENTVRSALAGATPLDWARGRAALKAMPEDQAGNLKDLATPGGMGGHQARLDEEDLGHLDQSGRASLRKAVSIPTNIWHGIATKIIGFQRALEQHAQTAALGVHMRQQLQQWGHNWADANTAVSHYADELAKGYADPAIAEDAARFVHETMGQYNNFTARQRWFISRVAPFAPWYMNAAKLVYKGLPVGHPLKTALLTDVAHANAPVWNAAHSGLPADMQSFAQLGPGHWLDVGKFTPIGLEKNPLAEGVPLLFPQYLSAALALYGKDPFGKDFKGPNTPYGKSAIAPLSPEAFLHAIEQLGEGLGGPAGPVARSLQSGGSTMYNTSMPLFGSVQLKPGTQHGPGGIAGGFLKQFNPFAGVYLNPKGGAAPAASGGGASKPGAFWSPAQPRLMAVQPGQGKPSPKLIKAFQNQVASYWAGLKQKGAVPANAPAPRYVIESTATSGNTLGGTEPRPYVVNGVIHFPYNFLETAQHAGPGHEWAREGIVHEMAHTLQNAAAAQNQSTVEGSAQAWADRHTPQVAPHFRSWGDGAYSRFTNDVRRYLGNNWIDHLQFDRHFKGPLPLHWPQVPPHFNHNPMYDNRWNWDAMSPARRAALEE